VADQATDAKEGDPMTILVRHAMTESPQTVKPVLTAGDAAALMKELDVGVIPVCEDGKLLGLVTDRDLTMRVLAERRDPTEVQVGEVMTRSPVTVTPDMKLSEARELMAQHKVRRLPVMKGEEIVGILSLGDVALADASERAVGDALEKISESDSTRDVGHDPDRGTPERVREARRTGTEG
jgi:CBS domain-containing protein